MKKEYLKPKKKHSEKKDLLVKKSQNKQVLNKVNITSQNTYYGKNFMKMN